MSIKIKENKRGFTLAEILVTLGVIGVIASMTVPTLVQDVQDAQFKAAWKKTFADISHAAKLYATDQAGNLSGSFGISINHDNFRNPFLRYLNYAKTCDANISTGLDGCWHGPNDWFYLSGTKQGHTVTGNGYSRAILNNGTMLVFEHKSSTCSNAESPMDDNCGHVWIDINGYKKPNKVGKDIFQLMILKDGTVIPWGIQGDDYYGVTGYICNLTANPTTRGWNCSADYLYK